MAKPTPDPVGGFRPIEVPVRDHTAEPGFRTVEVEVREPAPPRRARRKPAPPTNSSANPESAPSAEKEA